jgi:putative ABC transport system ATP-binding protein
MQSYAPEQAQDSATVPRSAGGVNAVILETHGLGKTYRSGAEQLTVLREITLSIRAGETCAIVGPSGSGKTTLLSLCAGLDDATTGTVRLDGQSLEALDQDARAALRNRVVGFVFQNFQLIPTLTALENVLVPLELRGESGGEPAARALLSQVGLGERLEHYPAQLSGGEQQRVALARAFIHRPRLLFADEPTGNLDAETSAPIVEMLFQLNREAGTALVLVTHDPALATRAGRIVTMRGGAIVSDETRP